MTTPRYKRILLKLSGEALMGDQHFGISPDMLDYVAMEVRSIYDLGVEIAIVVGGGNIFRGVAASSLGMELPAAELIYGFRPQTRVEAGLRSVSRSSATGILQRRMRSLIS